MLHSRRIAFAAGTLVCLALIILNQDGISPTRAAAPPARKSNIIRDIAYAKAGDPKNARRQTFDLYLPEASIRKPPLVVFIHGGFWTLSDDEYQIGPAFAEALLPSGVAVALVRYRLAPAAMHPAQAQDVAAAVANLIRSAATRPVRRSRRSSRSTRAIWARKI